MSENNDVRFYFEIDRKHTGNFGHSVSLDEFIVNDKLAVNGIGYLRIPAKMIKKGQKATFRVKSFNRCKSENWFRLGISYFVNKCRIHEGLEKVFSPKVCPAVNGYNVYFGDIHTHSGESLLLHGIGCGTGTRRENYDYAKKISCLDFFCMSEHDFQLNGSDWENLKKLNDEYNKDGEFITILGFEWTSGKYGHRNVYFRENVKNVSDVFDSVKEKCPILYGRSESPQDPNPEDLWNWLDEMNVDAITVAHHPNCYKFLVDFNKYFSEKYDKVVEIYSNWGSSIDSEHPTNLGSYKYPELEVSKFIGKYKFGFIASSDCHDGNPGNSNVADSKRQLGNYMGSGKVAILTDELTRNNVFNSLKEKRCYAVTGAPIVLFFSVNDVVMGGELSRTQADKGINIKVIVRGTDNIKELMVKKNNKVIYREDNLKTRERCFEIKDKDFQIDENSYYYLEVIQEDDELAWSSPVFYTGQN
jgi:hypothetical protein